MNTSQLVKLIRKKTDHKFGRVFKLQTRKEIMIQAKELRLKEIGRLPKNRLLERVQEKIRRDREAAGNMIEVLLPRKALRGAFTT